MAQSKAFVDASLAINELSHSLALLEAENAKLHKLALDLYAELLTYSKAPHYNVSVWEPRLAECGIDVSEIEVSE